MAYYNCLIKSHENMLLLNICKFGQALQNIFAMLFLIIFPLITGFSKSIKCHSVSKVKSHMILLKMYNSGSDRNK